MQGFILLNRKLRDNWLYQRPVYFHWFVDFLYRANFKDNNKYLFEGQFITIKRGQFITSYRKLANELPQCSEQKIKTFIKLLEKDKIISKKSIKKATQITIYNYDSYQSMQHDSNTVATQSQHSSNNNRKKENKENKENSKDISVFNFKKSLINLGIENQIVDDWMKVRKTKKATNTQTAFINLKSQILKSGKSGNECIKIAVENSWSGFNADWINKTNGQTNKTYIDTDQKKLFDSDYDNDPFLPPLNPSR